MAGLDPEDEGGDTNGSTNAASPVSQSLWQKWTSKPENNAALLQFGIAMMQPRAPGQSALGGAANALAEGGGAAGRVLASQRAEDTEAASEADKAAQRENQAVAAGSGRITAEAYARGIDNKPIGASAALKLQQGFRNWMIKPEDTTGMMADPVLGAVQKKFPNIKTKADLIHDPAATKEAMRLYSLMAPEAVGPDVPDTSGATAPPDTSGGLPAIQPRTIYDKNGKAYSYVPGKPPVPQ